MRRVFVITVLLLLSCFTAFADGHTHKWNYEANGQTFSAYCQDSDCEYYGLSNSIDINCKIQTGPTETIIANIEPFDAEKDYLIWTSSDPSVATVDQNGKINAIKLGRTTITVQSGFDNSINKTLDVIVSKVFSIKYQDMGGYSSKRKLRDRYSFRTPL